MKRILLSIMLIIMGIANMFSQNLLTNGNFTAGNTGFTSDYVYIANNAANLQRLYGVVTNPNAWENTYTTCGDHTTGTGNMMVVDGSGLNAGNDIVWSQTVAVTASNDYSFTYWVQNVGNATPARLQVEINGISLAAFIATPVIVACGNWTKVTLPWNSGAATSAIIKIFDRETSAAGNDFALDDLSFVLMPDATISGTVTVCQKATSPNVTFTGTNGNPPYTFTYNVNGGPDLTVSTVGASSTVNVPASTLTAGIFNYNLVSVTYGAPAVTNSLLANGDFSLGNVGFTSDYVYIPVNAANAQKLYGIVTNPNTWENTYTTCGDHTTTTGRMMVIDGSNLNAGNDIVWSETVSVTPNKNYLFTYWVQNVGNATPAQLEVKINGVSLGAPTAAPVTIACGNWLKVTLPWNSSLASSAVIAIYDRVISAAGNDFALDDLSFTPTETAIVTVLALPTATIAVQTGSPGISVANPIRNVGEATNLVFTGTPGALVHFTSYQNVSTPPPVHTAPFTESITLNASGTATYQIPFIAEDTDFTIVDVVAPSSPTPVCTNTFTPGPPPKATVYVRPLPNAPLPLIKVDINEPSTLCNAGECIDLFAHYTAMGPTTSTDLDHPLIGNPTDYAVNQVTYFPTFPFTGGTVIAATGDDTWSPVVNLPFNFNFYGVCYNQVIVGTNGVISFDLVNQNPGGYCNWPFTATIPGTGFPIRNAIYGVYQDTNIATPPVTDVTLQNVNYYVLSTGANAAPNRVFVANFNELPQYQCNASVGFQTSQIVIHEATNIIDIFVSKRTSCTSWNSGSGLIGVQNQAGTKATVPPGRNTGTWSATNEAWRFIPSDILPYTPEIRWEENGIPVPGSTNVNPLHVCPTTASSYKAIVKYQNCGVQEVSDIVNVAIAPVLPVRNPQNITVCAPSAPPYVVNIDQNTYILNGASPGDYIITYYLDQTDAMNGAPNAINQFSDADLATFTFNSFPITIYVRIEDIVGGCFNVRPFTINSVSAPGGTITYDGSPYCDTDTASVTEHTLTSGGVYSALPSGLNLNAATGAITPGSTAGTYTVTYSIAASPSCPAYSTTANVTIQPCVCNVVASAITVTHCEDTPLTPITYTVSGTATGAAVTGTLPTGVTGTRTGNVYTISGTPTTPGVYSYTVTFTTATGNCSASTTITVNTQPNAGTAGTAATVCDSSTTAINLFNLINGEQTGGTWTRTTGLGGTFNAAAGTFTPAPGATTSTFTYTITASAPCVNSTSVATVNINPQPDAGTAGTAASVCDNSTTAIDLFSLINGEQSGGIWTRNAGGTGGTFNAAAGTFTPAPGATNSTFTYTLTGTAPCVNSTSIATININPQPNAGTAGTAATVCDSSSAPINLFNLINGEQSGGTWTRNAGGTGGTFNAAAGTFTPAPGATTSTFTYTLTGTAPCLNSTSIATVNINAQPNAGVDGLPITVCDNSTTAIDLFSLITGEQTGGTWTRNAGGTGGTFNAAAGTYTPAPGATSSTFTYTLVGTAPCVNDTSLATININPQPNAGTDGSTNICDSSTTAIDLFSLITGEQTGGTWTRNVGGTGGTFNAAAGTFTPAAGATTSTFTYTLPGTAPCSNDTSLATVYINAQPYAGTDGLPITVCDNSTTPIDLFSLINGEQTGGTWTINSGGTGGTFNAAAGTFTPAPGATNSTFTYTLVGTAPCVNDTSLATININPQPNAGADGSTNVCDNSTTAIDLFSLITGEQAGGVWTRNPGGTGGTFNAAAGTYTPAPGATTSTFTYTLTGSAPCSNDTSLATVNINALPYAGTAGPATTICDTSIAPIDLFSLITGEQTGGTWTRNSGGTGGTFNAAAGTFTPAAGATTSTFTYTIVGTAPCPNSTSIATVNINPQPNAGVDGFTNVCDNSTSPIDLFSLITGEQTGGTWTRNSGGTGGTFNAAAGTFTPAPGATTSTFTYTLTGTAPCVNDLSLATVNISAQPYAGTNDSITICDSNTATINLFNLINGEQPGGTWTRNTGGTGGTFNAAAGTFTPAPGATTSTFTYTLTGAAPCSNSTSIATVTINPQPNAGTNGLPITICDSSTAPIDLFSLINGEQTGGTWTRNPGGTGGTFNAAAGTFTPAPGATSSTFTYSLIGTAPCVNVSSIATININAQPIAGTSGGTTICDSNTATINLFDLIAGEQTGGTWTRNAGGTGGTFNAAAGTFTPATGSTTSSFTYTINGTAPCVNSTSVATVTINPQPVAGTDGPAATVCDSSIAVIDLFSLITGEQAGGTWTRNAGGTGGTFNAAAGTFTPTPGATTSTFTYTVNGTTPCIAVTNIATVNINPQPNAGSDGNTTVCDSDNIAINLFNLISGEQPGGTWTRNPGGTGGIFNASAGTYTPAPGATTSTFTYTLTGIAPCVNDTSLATININPKRDAGTNGSISVCETSNLPIVLANLITGEESGGTWTRSTGTGGTFNAVAGTFIPLGATSSKFVYLLAGAAPCIDATSEATITVLPQPVAGNDGSTTVCETNTAVINLFDVITGEQTGGTWVRTSGTGGTFNPSAGTFIPAIGASTSTFTYTIVAALPCVPDSSIATVVVNPSVTIVLTSGTANQTLCINTPIQASVYTTGNGAAGAVLTGGLPTGVTGIFDTTTGKFTISGTPTIAGTFNYTITATGPCPGTPVSGQIIVNPRVTMVLDSATNTPFQTPCANTSITSIRYLVGNGATGAVATGLPPGVTTAYNATTHIFTISGTVNTVGVYNYSVHTTGGCGPDVTLTGTIEVIQNVTIALNSPVGTDHQFLCINNQIATIVYQVGNGATGATIVTGTVPVGIQGSFSGGLLTITGIPTEAGTFTYTVITSGGCSTATLTGTIVVNHLPVVRLLNGFVCVDEDGNPKPGSTAILDTGLTGNYTFVWSDENGVIAGQNGSYYTATAPGVYSVDVTDNYTHCSSSASATVVPSYPPVKVVATATPFFADQQQITVSVSPPGIYEYQLDNGAFQDSNQFVGFSSGYHTLMVRDKYMCGFRSTTILIIDYPKFFTPNGDGFNDTWNVPDLKYIDEKATIYIFDRYGKLVKEMSPMGEGWDGTMNTHLLPATDYWFKILYLDQGVSKEFKSHFAMKR